MNTRLDALQEKHHSVLEGVGDSVRRVCSCGHEPCDINLLLEVLSESEQRYVEASRIASLAVNQLVVRDAEELSLSTLLPTKLRRDLDHLVAVK